MTGANYLIFTRCIGLSWEFEHLTKIFITCRCMVAFPDDYKILVPKLLIETMGVVGTSFISRLNLATGNAVPETRALAKGWHSFLSSNCFFLWYMLFSSLHPNRALPLHLYLLLTHHGLLRLFPFWLQS